MTDPQPLKDRFRQLQRAVQTQMDLLGHVSRLIRRDLDLTCGHADPDPDEPNSKTALELLSYQATTLLGYDHQPHSATVQQRLSLKAPHPELEPAFALCLSLQRCGDDHVLVLSTEQLLSEPLYRTYEQRYQAQNAPGWLGANSKPITIYAGTGLQKGTREDILNELYRLLISLEAQPQPGAPAATPGGWCSTCWSCSRRTTPSTDCSEIIRISTCSRPCRATPAARQP